ncbi:MAG: hypothetical protein NTZ11_01215 [Gammaproteobacteria bacterium]|nr:hypothetical protein [Gammaproteobacteria bacterium]
MSRTLYEFQLPALVDEAALRRLRGELDMRTAMSIRYHDLNLRIVRVIGRTGRENELRALFASLGFPPAADDPTLESQHRPLRNRRWRDSDRRARGDVQAPPQHA